MSLTIWHIVGALVFLGIAGGFVYGIWRDSKKDGSRFDWGMASFAIIFGALGVMLYVIIALFPFYTVGNHFYDAKDTKRTEQIIAINDGGGLEGRFFILGGYINDNPVYSYYKQAEDGAITQHRIDTDQAKIYEDQETEAYIDILNVDDVCGFWGCTSEWNDDDYPKYEIHVPPGSVKREINFDLEE